MDETLVDRLRDAVRASGKSQTRLARDVGMTRSNVTRFLGNERASVSFLNGVRIARAIGFRLDVQEDPGDE